VELGCETLHGNAL